jgi:hypothetical protein
MKLSQIQITWNKKEDVEGSGCDLLSGFITRISMEKVKEAAKYISQDNRSLVRDLKSGPQEAAVPAAQSKYSINFLLTLGF